MGSGSGHKGIRREAPGGVSVAGDSTIGCPERGVLSAQPRATASGRTSGSLASLGSQLALIGDDDEPIAVARRSPEATTVLACILDGLSYVGTLEEKQGRWVIRYQET
jgi:hypothetical protein